VSGARGMTADTTYRSEWFCRRGPARAPHWWRCPVRHSSAGIRRRIAGPEPIARAAGTSARLLLSYLQSRPTSSVHKQAARHCVVSIGLQQRADKPALFAMLSSVADSVVGTPSLYMHGSVQCLIVSLKQFRKLHSNQASHKPGACIIRRDSRLIRLGHPTLGLHGSVIHYPVIVIGSTQCIKQTAELVQCYGGARATTNRRARHVEPRRVDWRCAVSITPVSGSPSVAPTWRHGSHVRLDASASVHPPLPTCEVHFVIPNAVPHVPRSVSPPASAGHATSGHKLGEAAGTTTGSCGTSGG